MDMNQDNRRDISDAVAYLNYLFSGGASPVCGDNTKEHPANIALLDCNGDGKLDIAVDLRCSQPGFTLDS